METKEFISELGDLGVVTTNNRGHSVNEVAEMATNKLVSISDEAPAPLRAQAHAFREFADLTFGTCTITARGCMIFNDTATGDPAVAVFDFGGDKTSTAGSFTISFPTANASAAVIRIA